MKKKFLYMLCVIGLLFSQNDSRIDSTQKNLKNNKLNNLIVLNKFLKFVQTTGFKPLISKDDILGWSYGIGFSFQNINDKPQQIRFGYTTGQINSYFLEYNKNINNQNYNYISNKISKSNQSNIENEYILTQNIISTYIGFINQLNIQIDFKYNKLNFNDILIEDVNVYEIKNSIYYNKIDSFKYQNLKHNNTLLLNYSFIIGDYQYHNKHNHFISIMNNYNINLSNAEFSPKITFKNIFILNSSFHIPEYEKQYLNSEEFVRGYAIQPAENSHLIKNKMKWNNIILFSMQFNIPFYNNNKYETELLLFTDYGLGSDQYNRFNNKNQLHGFGAGIRFNIDQQGGADICFGLNPYTGVKQFHFIANFKKF